MLYSEDQPGHRCGLVRGIAWNRLWVAKDSLFLHVSRKNFDQTQDVQADLSHHCMLMFFFVGLTVCWENLMGKPVYAICE